MEDPHAPRNAARPVGSAAGDDSDRLLFRRDFHLAAVPAVAVLRLFAVHRYRLRVNGGVVAYGPGRFVAGLEEHDAVDLQPHLAAGRNQLEVEVWRIDADNFQHDPAPGALLVAEGAAGGIDLGTPGGWLVAPAPGLRDDAELYSFAIGPVEVRDTRAEPGAFREPTVLAGGLPPPRTVPVAGGGWLGPRVVGVLPLAEDERRVGFVSVAPGGPGERTAYELRLHAEAPTRTAVSTHWGPHFLNGEELRSAADPLGGNRLRAQVELPAGTSVLRGEPEQVQARTPVLLGWPRAAGLRIEGFRFRPPGGAWVEVAIADGLPPAPGRWMAWDRVREGGTSRSHAFPIEIDGPVAVVLDHGREFLGHTRIEVTAAAGTAVDVAHEEGLRADGQLHFFRSNPLATGGDRFVCRGGRQTLESFLPRGGRWTQVTVRGSAVLHAVDTRDANAAEAVVGRVDTGDGVLDRAWAVGVETLRACTEGVFCDSPWRERGLYLGDAWVQSLTGLCVSADASVPARSLRLFAAAQRPDGRFPCVVPGWLGLPHADFDLLHAVWLRDVWARTGDLALVRDCLPAARRVLAAPAWTRSRHSILWDATEADRLFIDWGCVEAARTMPENAVLAALRIRAAECVAELSAALGEDPAPAAAEALAVREAMRERLWRGDRFAGGTGNPPVLHANVLALAFGIGDPDALLAHLRPQLAANAERAAAGPRFGGFLELYFLKFALDGLTRVGAYAEAEDLLRSHLAPMLGGGAWAFWETLHGGMRGDGSLCHAWSASVVEHLSRHVLGVREAEPGDPDRLVLDPRTTLNAASGVFPHRHGPVRVRWSRSGQGAEIDATIDAPPGVAIEITSAGG